MASEEKQKQKARDDEEKKEEEERGRVLIIPNKKGKQGKIDKQAGTFTEICTSNNFVASSSGSSIEAPSEEIRKQWSTEQDRLRSLIIEKDDEGAPWGNQQSTTALPELVGGTDISFAENSQVDACATIVVLKLPSLEVVYESYEMVKLTAPYISGFLAFREAPFLSSLLSKLRATKPNLVPQVLVVDGNGVLHPRGCGLASHLGVICGIPSIGVAKKLLQVDGIDREFAEDIFNKQCQGSCNHALLVGKSGRTLGAVYRSPTSIHPLYISTGHRISLDTAIKIVSACSVVRIPEPTRQADLRSREFLRQNYSQAKSATVSTASSQSTSSSSNHNKPKAKPKLLSGEEGKEAAIKLLIAADSGDIITVSQLLESGCDPNLKVSHPKFNKQSCALHYAARSGHVDIVYLLLSKGAEINIKDIESWTPLMYAVNSGNSRAVEVLVAQKADISIADTFHQRTALDVAKYKQFHDIVKMLGGDPNDTSYHRNEQEILEEQKNSPLMKGIHFGSQDLFLGRYNIDEEEIQNIECYRQYPDISPDLTVPAIDSVTEKRVNIIFHHERKAHEAAISELKQFIRASALSTNDFILVVIANPAK